jgi:hypothetical protein
MPNNLVKAIIASKAVQRLRVVVRLLAERASKF